MVQQWGGYQPGSKCVEALPDASEQACEKFAKFLIKIIHFFF
jgi:hypothetical protein